MTNFDRRKFLSIAAVVSGSVAAAPILAQDGNVTEPVYRISKSDPKPVESEHPLDPALRIAYSCLENIRKNITDYTAIVVKRERIDGELGEHEFMGAKIRHRRHVNGTIAQPFSVYLAFLKPATIKGREVIYVENQNNGKVVAHEGGMKGRFLPTVELDPHGMVAMRGQRYPIVDFGFENLAIKLIEKGERDRQRGECEVEFVKGAKVGGRDCTVVTVKHPVERPYFDFHIAQVFLDDELQIPVRYAAYVWPKSPGGEPELLEEYTYQNIKLNVGLTDADFDRTNDKYNF